MYVIYRSRCSCGTKVRIEASSSYAVNIWKERIEKWEEKHRKHGTLVAQRVQNNLLFTGDFTTEMPQPQIAKIYDGDDLTPSDQSVIVPPSSGDTPT